MLCQFTIKPAQMSASLQIREIGKPWGMDKLPAPFAAPQGPRIGEICFEPPAAMLELLVKCIFTNEGTCWCRSIPTTRKLSSAGSAAGARKNAG
jgi:hypothetical protein